MNPFTALKEKFHTSVDDQKDLPEHTGVQPNRSPSSVKSQYSSAIPNNPASISASPLLKASATTKQPVKPLVMPHPQSQTTTPSHKPLHSRSYEFRKQMKRSRTTRDSTTQRCTLMANYLEKIPLFARLSIENRMNVAKSLQQRIYLQDDTVIRQRDPGSEFYIITKGSASVHISTSSSLSHRESYKLDSAGHSDDDSSSDIVATLYPGDYFGETALLRRACYVSSVKVISEEMHCLILDKSSFLQIFEIDGVPAVPPNNLSQHHPHHHHPVPQQKDEATKGLIASAIENNVLFVGLQPDQISKAIDEMRSINVKVGDTVLEQGQEGEHFFVIESGKFNVIAKRGGVDTLIAVRSKGDSFGEVAIMYNEPQSATIRAATDFCKCWVLDRFNFRKILLKVADEKLKEYERFLCQVPLLDSLLVSERRAVAEALNEVVYERGDIIVEQGEVGNTFFVIKMGEAIVYKSVPITAPATEVARLKQGSFFGERALLKNEVRAATVHVISSKMVCLTLDRRSFCTLLASTYDLMHQKIDDDYDGIKDRILNNGTSNDTNPRNSNINAGQPRNSVRHRRTHSLVKKIAFADLTIIGILGRGSFGSVELVTHSHSNQTYALKTVSKSNIVRSGQQEHIISEKKVMGTLDSPFMVKLYETYNTDKYLYFLLEVVLGGELFTVLRARTVFDEPTARFYTASVVLAFDYMHRQNIIYRDLKPENLLLDSRGHLKITDFGFAKCIKDVPLSYTLCGTPDYLAPEVISGGGHSKGVDWWTLGVLLFEMLASYPPFWEEDPMRTYARIMKNDIKYPNWFSSQISTEAVECIKSFLRPKPSERLGIIESGGLERVKQHEWFTDFEWDALMEGELEAPIIPTIRNEHDRSNFETALNKDENEEEKEMLRRERKEAEEYVDDGSGWDIGF